MPGSLGLIQVSSYAKVFVAMLAVASAAPQFSNYSPPKKAYAQQQYDEPAVQQKVKQALAVSACRQCCFGGDLTLALFLHRPR